MQNLKEGYNLDEITNQTAAIVESDGTYFKSYVTSVRTGLGNLRNIFQVFPCDPSLSLVLHISYQYMKISVQPSLALYILILFWSPLGTTSN